MLTQKDYDKMAHKVKRNTRDDMGVAGGAERNRTAAGGFADLCLTTWLPRLTASKPEESTFRCYREPGLDASSD